MEFWGLLLELFNSREISLLFWNTVTFASLGIWVLGSRKGRESISNFLNVLFQKKIVIVTIAFFGYVIAVVGILRFFHLWSATWITDTAFWFFGTGLVIYFRINKASEQGLDFFKKIIRNSIAVIVVLEFIINLYTFPLIIELLLVPVITLLVLCDTLAGTREDLKPARKLTRPLLSIIGLTLLSFAIWDIVVNFEGYRTFETLYSFTLPIMLTIFTLPFFYLLSLYMVYEMIFTRIDLFFREADSSATVKREILRHCNVNFSRLTNVADRGVNDFKGLESREEIRKSLKGEKNDEPELPDTKKEQIYWDLVKAEDRATVEADIKFPTRIQDITAGFSFKNERLVLIDEEKVESGSKIKITERLGEEDSSIFPDFRARAFDKDGSLICEGKLEGIFLQNQGLNLFEENREKNQELQEKLQKKYDEEVLNKYEIDKDEEVNISGEAVENDYPTPEPLTVEQYLGGQDEFEL